MMPWPAIWAWIITAGLLIFGLVAIVVAIGGFFDVRAMFRSITAQHEAASERNADE